MKPTKREKIEKIKIPILNDEYFVYVLFGNEMKVCDWLRGYFDDRKLDLDDFQGFRARCYYKKGCYPVIYCLSKKHLYASLAHEAIHAVNYIWRDIGETEKEEVYAHSIGAIVYAVEKFNSLSKTRKKK